MAKYLRYITGVLLLISGVGLLLAPLTISVLGASQSMASFVGIVLVALGVTFLVTHFEDPDATLTGQLPGIMKKIGIYARGYILLLGVLLGGGLVFVFYVLDPLEAERVALLEDQKTLEKLNKDILEKLESIEEAGELHKTLRSRVEQDSGFETLLASYLDNARVPMRIALKCPGDLPLAPPRALRMSPFPDGRFGLVRDPSQTRSRGSSDEAIITLEGTPSDRNVILFSDADMVDEKRILVLSISRKSKDGAISALINLINPDLFKEMCIDQPEKSAEDRAAERESAKASNAACVPVSGPKGLEQCEGERQ